jgi:hypothetical protein
VISPDVVAKLEAGFRAGGGGVLPGTMLPYGDGKVAQSKVNFEGRDYYAISNYGPEQANAFGVAGIATTDGGALYFNENVWAQGSTISYTGPARSVPNRQQGGMTYREPEWIPGETSSVRLFDFDPIAAGHSWMGGRSGGQTLKDVATIAAFAAAPYVVGTYFPGTAAASTYATGGAAVGASTATGAAVGGGAAGTGLTSAEYAALGGMDLGTYSAADVALGYSGAAASAGSTGFTAAEYAAMDYTVAPGATGANSGATGGLVANTPSSSGAGIFGTLKSATQLASAGLSAYKAVSGALGTSSVDKPDQTPAGLVPRSGLSLSTTTGQADNEESMDQAMRRGFAPTGESLPPWVLVLLAGGAIYLFKRG